MSNTEKFNRLALFLAGLLGAGGVAAAAGASHAGDERVVGAIALIALVHAAVLLAFGLSSVTGVLLRAGAITIGAGACLFSADLAARHFLGRGLFPMSAPFGGTAIIAGWLLVALAGAVGRR